MHEDAQADLPLLACPGARAQRRSQPPLVAADGALDLPTLAVDLPREVAPHLSPIGASGPLARTSALLGRDDALPAEFLPDQYVRVLGVVAGIQKHQAKPAALPCLPQDSGALAHVVAGTARHLRRQKQVRAQVADDRELWIPREAYALAHSEGVVVGYVPRLQTRRIARHVGYLVQ